MILYKYLQPSRIDVLQNRLIRFTQPGDFNDPFEFRPRLQQIASGTAVKTEVEKNFDQLVDQELTKYEALLPPLPRETLKAMLLAQKPNLPIVFGLLEPMMLPLVANKVDVLLNSKVGVLCLSEVRDSILMWGHYTDNHRGLVIGFDSEHKFFSKKRTEQDEFGCLRRVVYQPHRPSVVLSDTSSPDWFQTKSDQWSYEKEWRIVRVLSEAKRRVESSPFPCCLFDYEVEAVREIIVGMRFPQSSMPEITVLSAAFPKATLMRAREDPSNYSLIIESVR